MFTVIGFSKFARPSQMELNKLRTNSLFISLNFIFFPLECFTGAILRVTIIEALCQEYLDSAGNDVTKLTQALVEMYGDLLFVAPTIPHALYHSSKCL